MLQSIRDNTQGWIAGTIISMLILSFGLWGIHSYLVGGSDTSVIAKVNGVEISKGQLAVAYDRLRRQLQMQFSSNYGLPEGAEAALKERALQSLINIQVLKQASIDQNYRISERQVDSLLESMPEFQVNSQFSLNRFQQVLATTLFNEGDFLELLRTSLLIDQPRLGLILTSTAMSNEVDNAIALVHQSRDIQYVTLSLQDYLKQPITIPSHNVEAYYEAHKNDFKTPEQVSVEYIELSAKDLAAALHPSDEELKHFYTENSSAFAEPMQWNLEAILIPIKANATEKDATAAGNEANSIQQKLANGGSFNEIAHQYPAGKLSEKLQGSLTLNKIPQDLQKAAMTLTKANQTSAPTKTESGIVILKAVDVKQAKILPYEQVKEKVKDALTRQQAEEKFATLRDKLANVTYEHPESLKEAADSLGLTIKSSDVFTKEKGGSDISSHTKIREAAFNNDVLNSKNNSDVIQLSTDTALVLRIKTHTPATLLTLKTVENQIIDKLKVIEADKQLSKQANMLKEKLASGAVSAEQIAQELHTSWSNMGYMSRHATKVDSAILNEAFAMPRPTAAVKTTFSTVKVPSGYAIIALSGVKDGSLNDNHEQYDVFAEQIQNSQGLLEYDLYKASLMKHSDITIENQQSSKPEQQPLDLDQGLQ